MLAAVSLLMAACSGGSDTPTPPTRPDVPVASVSVSGAPAENVLVLGATAQLSATARDAQGAALQRSVAWRSTDAATATVSPTGLVTAIAPGVAVILAESGGESGAVAIAVRVPLAVPPASASAPVTTVLLDSTLRITLEPGASATSSLTVGRGVIVTNDARLLTNTAFAIGPGSVTFTRPATVEVRVNMATVPVGKRIGLRLFRADNPNGLEPVLSSGVDVARGVVFASLAQGGTYVVVAPGDAAALVATEGETRRVEVGAAVPGVAVQARDAAGNAVAGASVLFRVEGALGTLTGDTLVITGIDGVAQLPDAWIAGPAKGTYVLRAQIVGTPLVVRFTATAFAPAVAVAVRTAPTRALSGVAFTEPIVVELTDAFGDRAEVTQPVMLSLTGDGGVLQGTMLTEAVNGGAIFQGQRIDGAGTYRIVASSPGLRPDTTAAIMVTQEVAALALITAPAGARSGVSFTTQPVVELRDAAGQRVVNGSAVVIARLNGSATLFGTRAVRAVDGLAVFTDLAVEGVGSVQLAFDSDGPITVSAGDLEVLPAPPGIRLLVGGGPVRNVNVNQIAAISLNFDLSQRGIDDLVVIDVTLTWDPTRFAYENRIAGGWRDLVANVEAEVTVDESQVSEGRIRFRGTSTSAAVSNMDLGSTLLRTLASGGAANTTLDTIVSATVNEAVRSTGGAVNVRVLPVTVTVFQP